MAAALRAGPGRWLFPLLCLLGFANLFASYLRLPILPLFAASLGAGPAEVGAINGAFMLSAGLLSIPAGLLADRVGRKGPIVAGIGAAALSALLVSLCQQPWQMAAAYVLFGCALAAFAPAMLSLVAEAVPGERLGMAYGWYTTAVYLAMAIGPAVGGWLGKTIGLRAVFDVSAALLVAVALLAALTLPGGRGRQRSDPRGAVAASVVLLRDRRLLACLLATGGSCIGFGVFLTFLPLYATGRGLDPAHVGAVFATQALTNVAVRLPIGRLADRIERRRLVAAGLLCLGVALIALGQAVTLVALCLCAIVLGAGMALIYTAVGALIATVTPLAQRGLAMGLYNSCIYLGMMSGATVLGVAVKAIGYPAGLAASGVVALVTLPLFYVLLGPPLQAPDKEARE